MKNHPPLPAISEELKLEIQKEVRQEAVLLFSVVAFGALFFVLVSSFQDHKIQKLNETVEIQQIQINNGSDRIDSLEYKLNYPKKIKKRLFLF